MRRDSQDARQALGTIAGPDPVSEMSTRRNAAGKDGDDLCAGQTVANRAAQGKAGGNAAPTPAPALSRRTQ